MTTGTVFDLASLTKVVATTTVAMTLVDEGRLDLDAPVRTIVPGFAGGAKDAITVRQLLTHSGGLLWWAPLYEELRGQDAYLERILEMDLDYEPGTKMVYTDLGLILLGSVLERTGGTSSAATPVWEERIEHTDNDEWGLQAQLVGSVARTVRRKLFSKILSAALGSILAKRA